MNFANAPSDSPLLDFDADAPLHLETSAAVVRRATVNVVATDPSVLAGLRQAYSHGADSGVIETLTLHQQLFFPRNTADINVFRFPQKTAAVVSDETGKPQIARLFVDNERWQALERGPSNAHFLTPVTSESPYAERVAVIGEIERHAGMQPSLPTMAIARNGERYFFNATVLHLMASGDLTLRAQDGVYGEMLDRAREGRFSAGRLGASTAAILLTFAYVMWMAEAIHLPLRLGAFYDGEDAVLRRYVSCLRAAVKKTQPLAFVPPQLQIFGMIDVGPAPGQQEITTARIFIAIVCDVSFDADADRRTYRVTSHSGSGGSFQQSIKEGSITGTLFVVASLRADGTLVDRAATDSVIDLGVENGVWVAARNGTATPIPISPVF